MKNCANKSHETSTSTVETSRDAEYWSTWFWSSFFPDWLARIQDDNNGVFDALDASGKPDVTAGKSLLTQARTLFTLAHTALLSNDPALIAAARKQAEFIGYFKKARGLYRCVATPTGNPTGQDEDEAARSYDHAFVILGLVTWNKVSPSEKTSQLIEECWEALQSQLKDAATGLLLNDDIGSNTTPAQNPHMHLYEACQQGYRMTNDGLWLDRADELRTTGLKYFMDQKSGSIAEFLTPSLQPLPGADGLRREIGHQCEWAWLLEEEAKLAKNKILSTPAIQLMEFANRFGFSDNRSFKGAAFDAVSATGEVTENSFLLWPQTEAIKILAVHHTAGDIDAGKRACELLCLMFERWFDGRPVFVNQLDANGNTIWPEALTRLMYHIVLAMTEGARAGLWADIPPHDPV